MPRKPKPKSRSGPNIPEAQRSGRKIQFRLTEQERRYLEPLARIDGITPDAWAHRAVALALDLPRTRTQSEEDADQAACDAEERERWTSRHDDD